ncbi:MULTISPECIES: putative DNA modification/repair radical SAM protein [unclassified Novosphingobium]|uniref:putative DNA modification/repair radical SAM protein n=1 Tax=unclassified Novosphingobium TaxID=2644732 RepID=UPI001493F658|nr:MULTISPECIES: putative DNA modification/repair radical SAM protein [unclassified Novosphingobium]MBB3358395.1 putative DNA modification/repair radical SAM protein [Novosphingobium sp. BK256]MBB3374756.1 putative DNA modification/repair radical SAM protein [Novosphingobium sp. BK280]MBB3379555.1 putative DNA modification/repair radical SAM protein [Novosphingobium sp. BK258]MBB3421250.1 putative DNA modification/repair radical SAM protein [Novosphingobium sp. BK267]MBB3449177.1 putative DNA 
MSQPSVMERLGILADAAKYDASCASSGTAKRNSAGGKGLGSTEGMGICHAYAPDGRCISLLKILLTNHCIFDCHYCVNRKSSNVRRARFTPQEVADLTIAFYRRNYIEGLFLSSGIVRSSNHTMEQLIEAARILREEHEFRGYIHLKTIPEADPELVARAGLYADRVSINVELPTQAGLARLAPDKSTPVIEGAMASIGSAIVEAKDARKRFRHAPRFAPAGQSTQMIVGADQASDADIVGRSATLYSRFRLRRVYYSAFSPIPDASAVLPLQRPPLMREHRLYQSDWLMRFYGFAPHEVQQAADAGGMLPLDIDPKLAWALRFRDAFPVDVNRAPREALLRVPGLGVRAVNALLSARRQRRLRLEDVGRLTVSLTKVRPFIVTADWRPTLLVDRADLRASLAPPKARQLELFGA